MNLPLRRFLEWLRGAPPPEGWRVDITEEGRGGHVHYREAAGTISFYWEFGGIAVAILSFDSETQWEKKHPWATGRRAEILERVAAEVIRRKAPSCHGEIDERSGSIEILNGSAADSRRVVFVNQPPPLPDRALP
jgi:hypothetical protein